MQGITSKNHGIPHFLCGIAGALRRQYRKGATKKMRKAAVIFVQESGKRVLGFAEHSLDQYLQNTACTNFAREKSKAHQGQLHKKSNMPKAKN